MQMTPVLDQLDSNKPIASSKDVYYPESDGKPVGETDWHITVIFYLRQALRLFFRDTQTVYVAADMLFYYEEGNPATFVVPDVYVVKGITKQERRIYKLWEEQKTPCVVFEITSRSTRRQDLGDKRALYEMLGVQEYFLFDPLGEYLHPQLQAFRLRGGFYAPIAATEDGAVFSEELQLTLQPEAHLLRLIDPVTGQTLPTLDEAVELMVEALGRAQVEHQRAEQEAQRAEQEAQRAEQEAQRAEQEARRTQAEAQRADAAEAELVRLRAELEALKRLAAND
jgi:Uma2 family endonuclease